MDHEIGFMVCRTNRGGLTRGPTRHGDKSSVTVPVKCPAGAKPEALWHTHPSGSLRLSPMDIATGRDHKIPHVCVSNGKKGSTRCYRTRRVR